ncbi:hypothetical protein EJA72_07290 [Pseudomonas sp. PB120]|nr:hypothetical protein [Pseudomonas sp. PB120]
MSLLAMAVFQSPWILNVPASSRAGSLPQLFWVFTNPVYAISPCWSELAREGGVSVAKDVEGTLSFHPAAIPDPAPVRPPHRGC